MKHLRKIVAVVAATVIGVAALVAAPAPARAGAGSLYITSSHGGDAVVYDAYRIADDAALPDNAQFNWPGLSGVSLDGYEPYPAYDPASPNSARDGRALVERVSADVSVDNAGVLAHALEGYVVPGAAPVARVKADGPAVAVPDGWYLLRAHGRRTLFAWVDGGPVELGDKSDTPVVGKQVSSGAGWGRSAVAGSGRVVSFRVDAALPLSMEAARAYPLAIDDSWDEGLVLDTDSIRVELLANDEPARDLTDAVEVEVSDRSIRVASDDLRALGAEPGNALRLSYKMTIAPGAKVGVAGLSNSAHAGYEAWTGHCQTPAAAARVFAANLKLSKVDASGAPLAGAVVAIRRGGEWLLADGSFGAESARLELASGEDGAFPVLPVLSDGSYEVVELSAPKGYRAADHAVFQLGVHAGEGDLTLDAWASKPLRVAGVDAESATASLELVNEKAASGWPGFIPQTGDTAWWLAAATLAVAGAAVLVAGARRKCQGA